MIVIFEDKASRICRKFTGTQSIQNILWNTIDVEHSVECNRFGIFCGIKSMHAVDTDICSHWLTRQLTVQSLTVWLIYCTSDWHTDQVTDMTDYQTDWVTYLEFRKYWWWPLQRLTDGRKELRNRWYHKQCPHTLHFHISRLVANTI